MPVSQPPSQHSRQRLSPPNPGSQTPFQTLPTPSPPNPNTPYFLVACKEEYAIGQPHGDLRLFYILKDVRIMEVVIG